MTSRNIDIDSVEEGARGEIEKYVNAKKAHFVTKDVSSVSALNAVSLTADYSGIERAETRGSPDADLMTKLRCTLCSLRLVRLWSLRQWRYLAAPLMSLSTMLVSSVVLNSAHTVQSASTLPQTPPSTALMSDSCMHQHVTCKCVGHRTAQLIMTLHLPSASISVQTWQALKLID